MRELVAGLVAIFLLLVALILAAALHHYRTRRQRAKDVERAMGRSVIAELPAGTDLILFSEDPARFYYGEEAIDKDQIVAARLLVNGSPIAAAISTRLPQPNAPSPTVMIPDQPEGILRDRWDVAIETLRGTVVVECGAIRERVSQELARAIFDAIRIAIEN
jgi:hypothetical protein